MNSGYDGGGGAPGAVERSLAMTTTPEEPGSPLEDSDIETVTGSTPQPATDADGTDGGDADGTDADGTDGDSTDSSDGDSSDSDATDG